MNKYRTHMMDGITLNDIGKEIMLSGWVKNPIGGRIR